MSELIAERTNQVLTITLNRPRVMNALSIEMVANLKTVLQAARGDSDLRAVVIAGTGDNFCAGADIRVEKSCSLVEYRQFVTDIQDITVAIRNLDAIAIAAIQGNCLGGGMEIACACDLRVAAEDARLGFPEVGLGLTITSGASQILPRLIGSGRAKEMTILGTILDGPEAYRVGLVNRVVARAELMDAVSLMADQVKTRGPLAVATQKHLIDAGAETPIDTILRYEVDSILTTFASQDGQEGMQAFIEKRSPRFRGA